MSLRRRISAADGRTISYLATGDGPVVLMVPGLLQSAALWRDRGYIDALSDTHRVVAIDPLGHGESDKPHDPAAYGAERAVGDVVRVLEAENATHAAVWGYASGAETTLDLARRRPDLVRCVVVGGIFLGDFAAGLRQLGFDLRTMTETAIAALDRGDWEAYFAAAVRETPAERRDELAASNDPAAIAAILRSDLRRPRGFLRPQSLTFAYWGADEVFVRENRRLAESAAIDWAIVPGSHADAFLDAGRVVERVGPFLRECLA